ncbi:biopolymer transport protein ExbD/TolR [Sphaerotilus natans subsp. natans DSM 6575]|uniref:Biopolymer transport protein ExbD/TolR n=1 Tax=Sphaerotilus natans subsp. natans DSM 6575 TaxID=1286631 RepID=A0A059KSK7_9BURK|nr:biopolymer transporter ExbD [Sphaerotilus natans]KDB54209.1 biopolymer transport protein ExbD/TolR [Sphaerotilus natans subsp. natans DSM 6575]SIQ21952.1 biopolymer transport protein ExbD/biopolymer transport protein TolR [Sphaerotilus natans]
MAFGRLERRQADAPMSDINMTPLIDVMLVLLVIFMITAPLMSSSLKLELPEAEGAQPTEPAPEAVQLSLQANGALYWGEERLEAEAFARRLAEVGARPGERPEVMLRADQSVAYGRVAELIGQLQQAGLNRIAFVTERAAEGSAR